MIIKIRYVVDSSVHYDPNVPTFVVLSHLLFCVVHSLHPSAPKLEFFEEIKAYGRCAANGLQKLKACSLAILLFFSVLQSTFHGSPPELLKVYIN